MSENRKSAMTDRSMVSRAVKDAFLKLDPREQVKTR